MDRLAGTAVEGRIFESCRRVGVWDAIETEGLLIAEPNIAVSAGRYGDLVGGGSIGGGCSVGTTRLSTKYRELLVAALDSGKVQSANTLTGCHRSTVDLVLLAVALVPCEAQIG